MELQQIFLVANNQAIRLLDLSSKVHYFIKPRLQSTDTIYFLLSCLSQVTILLKNSKSTIQIIVQEFIYHAEEYLLITRKWMKTHNMIHF